MQSKLSRIGGKRKVCQATVIVCFVYENVSPGTSNNLEPVRKIDRASIGKNIQEGFKRRGRQSWRFCRSMHTHPVFCPCTGHKVPTVPGATPRMAGSVDAVRKNRHKSPASWPVPRSLEKAPTSTACWVALSLTPVAGRHPTSDDDHRSSTHHTARGAALRC